MNYNTDSFIIDAGQHLQTIMFKAPRINGVPLDYHQTKIIFNALHESVFNSIFPWANINNHPMTAIEEVYKDFRLITTVDGYVYQCLGQDSQGNAQYSNAISYDRDSHQHQIRDTFLSESELPSQAVQGSLYMVGGDITPEQWVNYLVYSVLEPIGVELKKAILVHAGTRRKFEWHFEYVSNGVFYTLASSRPAIVQQKVTPLTEYELINQTILNQQERQLPKQDIHLSDHQVLERALLALRQPKPVQRPMTTFNVDIRPYANDAQFAQVLQHAVGLLSNPNIQGTHLKIVVTYTVQGYFDKLVNFINQFIETNRLDIVASVKGDWVRDPVTTVSPVDHQMQHIANNQASIQDKLLEIRRLIVKANNVTDLQGRELHDLAPELFGMGFTPSDMAELMNVEDPTLRFYGKDPMLINQNVLMMCLAIDRYLEGPALPQVVAAPKPAMEIPLASLNMNGLLVQELQAKLAALNKADANYEKMYRDIIVRLAKLSTSQ